MLKIYVTRHGQNLDNVRGVLNGHRDEPLTSRGEEQAHGIAEYIKESGITLHKIYCSPLERARRTAEIISQDLEMELPENEEDLIERDYGVMTGQPVSKIEELCSPEIIKTDTITYFLSPEGAETFLQVIARAKRLLERLRGRHTDGSILLVTHGDIGKMIYAAYYNLDWKQVLSSFHFSNGELLLLAEDSPAEATHIFKQTRHNQ